MAGFDHALQLGGQHRHFKLLGFHLCQMCSCRPVPIGTRLGDANLADNSNVFWPNKSGGVTKWIEATSFTPHIDLVWRRKHRGMSDRMP